MPKLPTVLIRPGKADRLAAGHPWVYTRDILRITSDAEDGQAVQIKDHRQRFLGIGFYNSQSRINVRILSREKTGLDRDFMARRIREALELRRRQIPDAENFRVVNAEGDFLSGLIVDKYGDVLVLQTPSLAMDHRKEIIADILDEIFSPRAIIERNDMPSRRHEGLQETKGLLRGSLEKMLLPITMDGLKLEVDLLDGQKTGLYLDQQENHQFVGRLARDRDVLDCFTFTGGFALHAARAGARRVLGLDQSAAAVAAAKRHGAMNGLSDCCEFSEANVFDWLKAGAAAKKNGNPAMRFDMIVLDPPSFTRNRAAVPNALRGYKEIHLRALQQLRPGGVLATFCCSHHVDPVTFENVILDASVDARRTLRRTSIFTQSPDHPVIPIIPETEYLKGFAFEVVD